MLRVRGLELGDRAPDLGVLARELILRPRAERG
jgi:hypothetical protein